MKPTKMYKINSRKRDKMIALRISAITLNDLDKWCKKNGMKKSNLVNYIIHEFLYEQ